VCVGVVSKTKSLWNYSFLFHPPDIRLMNMKNLRYDVNRGVRETATNSTRMAVGMNSGFRGKTMSAKWLALTTSPL